MSLDRPADPNHTIALWRGCGKADRIPNRTVALWRGCGKASGEIHDMHSYPFRCVRGCDRGVTLADLLNVEAIIQCKSPAGPYLDFFQQIPKVRAKWILIRTDQITRNIPKKIGKLSKMDK